MRGRSFSDEELMAFACVDPRRFWELFDRCFEEIHRYVCRRVGSLAAEDLTTQVFLAAFDARARYDPRRGSVKAWLFGITANLLRMHSREELRQLRLYAVQRTEDADDDAIERLDSQARWPRLFRALLELPESQREVVLLFAWADLSYDEIASALDVPVGTVRSRLSRARNDLIQHLGANTAPARATKGDHNGSL